MAYLLLVLFIPVAGIVFYILFGVNYWKTKLYSKKSVEDEKMLQSLKKQMKVYMDETITPSDLSVENNRELAIMLAKELRSPLTRRNKVKLLLNGEEKYSLVRVVRFGNNPMVSMQTVPNPFVNNFIINYTAAERETITIRMFNVNGQQMLMKNVIVNDPIV